MAEQIDVQRAMIRTMSGPAAVRGETDEFRHAYELHYRDVFRYCLILLRESADAEDVAAEAFERGLRARRSGRGPEGEQLPWLLLTARRIVIDRARRRRLLHWLPLVATPAESRSISQSETERVEFWLWFDRPILGLSEPGVRSLASRAIAALRQHPELIR